MSQAHKVAKPLFLFAMLDISVVSKLMEWLKDFTSKFHKGQEEKEEHEGVISTYRLLISSDHCQNIRRMLGINWRKKL